MRDTIDGEVSFLARVKAMVGLIFMPTRITEKTQAE